LEFDAMDEQDRDDGRQARDFQDQANQKPPGLVAEFLQFLVHEKKWWLIPIALVLLLMGLLVVLGGTGAAPFIYTLF
jgi:hypothetical protein